MYHYYGKCAKTYTAVLHAVVSKYPRDQVHIKNKMLQHKANNTNLIGIQCHPMYGNRSQDS